MIEDYIEVMLETPGNDKGFDIIIVSTNSAHEASYWQERLDSTRGSVCNKNSHIFSIHEDWGREEGAGNLLGTLYAWKKAAEKWQGSERTALLSMLRSGKSVAMYHIAGLGTRLAPLPGSECNSKSAVKLPCHLSTGGGVSLMTLLEAVILQTGPFALSRKGRLSVFWGDQIFIPSGFQSPDSHHVEMLSKRVKISKDAENYGLLISGENGDAYLREKMKLDKIFRCVSPDASGERYAGISMGSFDLSHMLLEALLDEYHEELTARNNRLNTDADLWQPLTSTYEEYVESGKNAENWQRVSRFWETFQQKPGASGLRKLGSIDIGESYWWDFGQLQFYQKNLLKILEDTVEAVTMRRFFQIMSCPGCTKDSDTGNAGIFQSVVLGSTIRRGTIKSSIIINSHLVHAELDHCIVIDNVVLGKITGSFSLSYRDLIEGNLFLEPYEGSAGIFIPPSTHFRMRVMMTDNGKENWRRKILDNPHSFFEVWQILKNVNRNEQQHYFDEKKKGLLEKKS